MNAWKPSLHDVPHYPDAPNVWIIYLHERWNMDNHLRVNVGKLFPSLGASGINIKVYVFTPKSGGTTLPETNSSPLKVGLPQRKLVFQPSIFRYHVSFREATPESGGTIEFSSWTLLKYPSHLWGVTLPKRNVSSSNQQFSGALLTVSFREGNSIYTKYTYYTFTVNINQR